MFFLHIPPGTTPIYEELSMATFDSQRVPQGRRLGAQRCYHHQAPRHGFAQTITGGFGLVITERWCRKPHGL